MLSTPCRGLGRLCWDWESERGWQPEKNVPKGLGDYVEELVET